MAISRRTLVAAGLAGIAAPRIARSAEPEFRLKFGNIVSGDHPLNTGMAKARDRITRETDGKVLIQLFPKNQLGSDADMLAQLRSGALEMFAQTGVLMSTLVPVASITGIGFAFPNYEKVWEATDGALGRHVRTAFEKANLAAWRSPGTMASARRPRRRSRSGPRTTSRASRSGCRRARCGRRCSRRSGPIRSRSRGPRPTRPCRPGSPTASSSR